MSGTIDKKLEELKVFAADAGGTDCRCPPSASCAPAACCSCPANCASPTGTLVAKGKLGPQVTVERDPTAARCRVNLLAQVKAALGDLDKVVRVVRLGGCRLRRRTFSATTPR